MGLARRHQRRVLAEKAALDAGAAGTMDGPLYDQMLILLAAHMRELKQIQSARAKEARKADMLPEYNAYVDGVLAADSGVQDDVVMTVAVWALDAGDYDRALQVADYGLRHGLALPDRFRRDLPTFLAEEMADAALAGEGVTLDHLDRTQDLTADHDKPDEVTARLHKALGAACEDTDPAKALDHYDQALKLDPGAGVKTAIKRVTKQIDRTETCNRAPLPGTAAGADGKTVS